MSAESSLVGSAFFYSFVYQLCRHARVFKDIELTNIIITQLLQGGEAPRREFRRFCNLNEQNFDSASGTPHGGAKTGAATGVSPLADSR